MFGPNLPKKGIFDLTNKKSHFAYAHGRYYIKLFRTGADRHNGILMSVPSSRRDNEGISEYYKLSFHIEYVNDSQRNFMLLD